MNKLKKMNILILTIFIIANMFSFFKTISNARVMTTAPVTSTNSSSTTSTGSGKGISIDVDDYKPSNLTEDTETINFANNIIGLFQALGSIVSVLALVLIGIKYMMGSVEEKAEYKQTMIYYIIGAILVFAISNISAVIYDFAQTLNS